MISVSRVIIMSVVCDAGKVGSQVGVGGECMNGLRGAGTDTRNL